MTESEVKDAIAGAFPYCYEHDHWVTGIDEALGGLTVSEALHRPTPECKCIWEIVLHVAIWNDNIIERTRTREACYPVGHIAWPALPADQGEQAWEEAKVNLRRSIDDVARLLERSTLDELNAGPYGIGDLFCRFFHIAYHLGQIVKQREILNPGLLRE